MVPFGSETLFPARVLRFRVGTTNVAGDYSAVFAQFSERPFKIPDREPATLPICHRVIRPKTIEIDRDVNILATQIRSECFEIFSPILAQDCAATLSIFDRTLISPGVNFQPP